MRIRPRNLAAKALQTPQCRQQIVRSRKGKGAYTRRLKHKARDR
jgi:stalled ribosome alternative rescue factor ArfA